VDIPTKFHEVWWKESKNVLNPPFFVPMATVAKFVQLIPIFLAYLVPLDMDVHFSQRLFNGNQWNFTWMLSTMSRCADYFRNFQNGLRCHGKLMQFRSLDHQSIDHPKPCLIVHINKTEG
jgi:hypothetical protein